MAFTMRTSKPGAGNKYYITKAAGGWSDAIVGSPKDNDCNVLSNCVGYAYGRFNEIGGYGSCKYLSPVNAENFIQYKGSALEVGQIPKVGACMVWQKGATLSGSDGAGHVAIVERVDSNTQVLTSESGWGSSTPFWTQIRKKGNGNWGAGSDYKFLGFIYNPAVNGNTVITSKYNLQIGMNGNYVKELQDALIKCGYSCGSMGADGDFGNNTLNALKYFQKDHNLTVDGVAGAQTWAAIEKQLNNISSVSNITGTVSTGSAADEKIIWDFLLAKINNAYGVAGLMGNLYAESSLRSNNLQNIHETKLNYTDATYTSSVDNGTYSNFIKDGAGYGLAQWTYWSRKEGLLSYARSKSKSIGDLTTQLEYLYKELSESYKTVLNVLKTATSIKVASNIVLTKFECPANQSTSVQDTRANYGQEYYDKYNIQNSTGQASQSATLVSNDSIEIGDLVSIASNATYWNGAKIPDWVKDQQWYVYSIGSNGCIIINQNEKKTHTIMSPIDRKYLTVVLLKQFQSYKIKVTVDALNYRAGAGTENQINGIITDGGIYTIIAEAQDSKGYTWGKLKSGAGWINLQYTKKI